MFCLLLVVYSFLRNHLLCVDYTHSYSEVLYYLYFVTIVWCMVICLFQKRVAANSLLETRYVWLNNLQWRVMFVNGLSFSTKLMFVTTR